MDWQYSNYSKINPEVRKHFPFSSARENQLETISEIVEAIDNGYKYIILEAGTGTGKSAIAATLAQMYGPTYILTVTKQLQDQYLADFNELGFKLVKGRNNFKCRKYAEDSIHQTCDEGRCILENYNCEYSIKNKFSRNVEEEYSCYYDYQKYLGLMSDVVISNYHYMFLELNYVRDFIKRKLMIFDEAHNLEDTIMNQLKLELSRKVLKEDIGVNLSTKTVKTLNNGDYKTWLDFIDKIKDRYKEEYDKIKDIKNRPEITQKIQYLKNVIENIDIFIYNIKKNPDIWIFDYDSYWGVAEFKPIKVDKYAKDTFLRFGEVCIFMSATILDYKLFSEWLGLGEEEVYAIRQKSPFEINRNPIKTFSEFNMSYQNLYENAPKTLDTIREILEKHSGEKGIIHTISYNCKNFLMKNIETDRFIDHKTHNRSRRLDKFKKSKRPLVLISPSMNEGVDLPGDLCRFQIIYKIPYPTLADKQTNLRSKIDQQWYEYKTSLLLVQTVGRGMRYEDDYCMTYFIDSRLDYFILKDELTNHFLPDPFKQAINIEPAKIDKSKVKKYEKIKITPKTTTLNEKSRKEIPSDYESRVNLKYDLTIKGNDLIDCEDYDGAVKFYTALLTHELFTHDYHPYLKLAKAYHDINQYDNEAEIIERFFGSGIYARNSTIKWFKRRLKKLDEMGHYDYSNVDELESKYKKSGKKNRKLSKIPVPWAGDIKSGRTRLNDNPIVIDPHIFDDFVKVDENATDEEKNNFKQTLIEKGDELFNSKNYPKTIAYYTNLLGHELFINDYMPYKKLSLALRKDHQRKEEAEILTRFFKSGINCDNKQIKWFVNRLKQLSNYGHFDPSRIKELKQEYYNNQRDDDSIEYNIEKPEKKSPTEENKYSQKYFDFMAKRISNEEGFISDSELLKHSDDDFAYIGTSNNQLNEKADLKNRGKELERKDPKEAVRFYNDLKTNKLFENDYYPYRRQCILFKKKIKNDIEDWKTIKEIFKNEIYLNRYQYIWLKNKVMELTVKLDLNDGEIYEMEKLLQNFDKNHEKFKKPDIPIAERIFKEEDGEVKLLSAEKYDYIQDIFYVKELGVGYIRRRDYENAFPYYFNLVDNDFLFFRYHAYKQFARIYREMKDPVEFERLYEKFQRQ